MELFHEISIQKNLLQFCSKNNFVNFKLFWSQIYLLNQLFELKKCHKMIKKYFSQNQSEIEKTIFGEKCVLLNFFRKNSLFSTYQWINAFFQWILLSFVIILRYFVISIFIRARRFKRKRKTISLSLLLKRKL